MMKKGLLLPVSPGRFVIPPEGGASDLQLAAPIQLTLHAELSSRTQYFLSYFTGLIEHGLTDLDESTIYVAVRQSGVRLTKVGGTPVRLTRITTDRKWFGLEKVRVGTGRRVPFYWRATLERVLLDTLDRPRLCGSPEIVARAWERAFRERRIDVAVDTLAEGAVSLGASVARRAGFWLTQLGQDQAASHLRQGVGRIDVPVLLDASKHYGEQDWPVDRDWGLIKNVPQHAVRGWLAYGK